MIPQIITKIITNFRGSLTRNVNGLLNSGLAKYVSSFGYDPFSQPYTLKWYEDPVQIDSAGTVIQDLILKFKERVESGIPYVYGIGYAGRFYKITVSSHSPALVSATALNLKYGGGMEFYTVSGVEYVFIGNDAGVTRIGFDGSGATAITSGVTWVSNVPRPIVVFNGIMYIGNDTNIVEIGIAGTVTSGAKLSPTIPPNWHIRDMKVSEDGTYLAILATRLPMIDIETSDPLDISSNQESGIFYWNGIVDGISSEDIIPSFTMTSLDVSSQGKFQFGYDLAGAMVRKETDKILTQIFCKSPLPNATDWNGNLIGWDIPEWVAGHLKRSGFIYGSLDSEFGLGWWRNYKVAATGDNTEVMVVGATKIVSSLSFASNSFIPASSMWAYTSTYETGGTPTIKLYRWSSTTPAGGTSMAGVYETQNELFAKKMLVSSVRFYVDPTIADNGFQMDLIGSDQNVISGSTKTYTYAAGTDQSLRQGAQTIIEFSNLQIVPNFAIGLRITNTGTTNMVFHKIEIDLQEYDG